MIIRFCQYLADGDSGCSDCQGGGNGGNDQSGGGGESGGNGESGGGGTSRQGQADNIASSGDDGQQEK